MILVVFSNLSDSMTLYFWFVFLAETREGKCGVSGGLLSAWGGMNAKVIVFSRRTPLLQALYLGNMSLLPSAYYVAL